MILPRSDHFLSEEDLDLKNMTMEELIAWWQLWLEQSQATNDQDRDEYSHGVFRHEPVTKSSAIIQSIGNSKLPQRCTRNTKKKNIRLSDL